MGYGGYSLDAHTSLTKTRMALPTQAVFKQRECHPLMNPKGVKLRESRDSVEHPESLGVVFALDVTGSMGKIPDLLARRDLPLFMQGLQDLGVKGPQLLFLAIGDAYADRAPLQVGQFESTAELMDQWLTWSWLEGGGGKLGQESYELALYFCARHVDMDCFRKRGKRGYLFLTGDEDPYTLLSRHVVEQVMGETIEEDLPLRVIVDEVQRHFEPFFLIPDLERRQRCERSWRDQLGDRVIALESPDDVCRAAAALVALTEGDVEDLPALLRRYESGGVPRERIGALYRALLPYATSLEKDGAPMPELETDAKVPEGNG
ncbi:MAG: VWA domain-containing protein [Sandaracinus sp.]|nr:VWA domain-containing protein [Sandaracinus sp.]